MTSPPDPTPAQQARLARFRAESCVDLHCHCLPGVDDGPADMDAALALCRALADDGVTTVVATPHQFGRYEGRNEPASIRAGVAALSAALVEHAIPLKVCPGADVRLHEHTLDLLDTDGVMTIGDAGGHLLLELPHEVLIDFRPLVSKLKARGITAILSHPERHEGLTRHPEAVRPWLRAGAILQITAGSLVGDFGPVAQKLAWHWLTAPDSARSAVVATDAHDPARRPPRLTAAIDAIAERLSHPVARRLCITNPGRVLKPESSRAETRGR